MEVTVVPVREERPVNRPSRSSAWVPLSWACASLAFSLWVAVFHPNRGSFLARYGLVSFGVAIVASTLNHLLFVRTGKRRWWLSAIYLTALGISMVGLYQSWK
jgi:protein-S-isoprenylcysteine O-methyltransferase Ste14